jgi:uncharacterized membrane protein YdjX (TVP38/TMEM64 family)
MRPPRGSPFKPLLFLLAVAGLALAGHFLPVTDWLRASQAWVAARGALGMAFFFVLYVTVTMAMGPAWILTVAAGLTWSFGVALPLVWVSATAGAAASFLLGRTLARHRIEALVARNEVLAAIDRAVEKKGWRIVFLLRLSPVVPFVFSNYVYGLTAIRLWPYVASSALGMLPLAALYVAAGTAGKAALGGAPPKGPWVPAAFAVGALLTLGVTLYVARLAKRELEESRLDRSLS